MLQERTRGGLQQRQAAKLAAQGICYNFSTLTMQTRHELGLEVPTRHQPHPTLTLAINSSNKRYHKPNSSATSLMLDSMIFQSYIFNLLPVYQSKRQPSVAPGGHAISFA